MALARSGEDRETDLCRPEFLAECSGRGGVTVDDLAVVRGEVEETQCVDGPVVLDLDVSDREQRMIHEVATDEVVLVPDAAVLAIRCQQQPGILDGATGQHDPWCGHRPCPAISRAIFDPFDRATDFGTDQPRRRRRQFDSSQRAGLQFLDQFGPVVVAQAEAEPSWVEIVVEVVAERGGLDVDRRVIAVGPDGEVLVSRCKPRSGVGMVDGPAGTLDPRAHREVLFVQKPVAQAHLSVFFSACRLHHPGIGVAGQPSGSVLDEVERIDRIAGELAR